MSGGKTAATVLRDAAVYVRKHGLCKDGSFGEPGGPCCTVGAVRVVDHGSVQMFGISPQADRTERELINEVSDTLDAFVTDWNDDIASVDDVLNLYARVAARLDAGSGEQQ